MSLLLTGIAFYLAAASAAAPEVAAGTALDTALDLGPVTQSRYGVDGAPPGGYGQVPTAPDLAGPHSLVEYDAQGQPRRWWRFVVPGDAGEAPVILLGADRTPPQLKVKATGTVLRDGTTYAAAQTRIEVEADDPSGLGDVLALHLNDQPVADPDRLPWPDADGEVTLVARASDALGNLGTSAPLRLQMDRTPPTLGAERAMQREGVAADIVAPGEPIRLLLADAGAGLATLELGGTRLALEPAATQTLAQPMPATPAFVLTDRLGNQAQGDLPLRLDDAPPRLLLISDGRSQPASDGARLPRSEQLEVVAEDPLAGVARACVELSIWYGECRPLPLTLVGIDPGRYRLVFRAMDRLGHKASERFEIEVLP